jgi:hypothetical protein
MRIFLDTITTMRMIFSMGALRYPTKVYTLLRLFIFLRATVGSFEEDELYTDLNLILRRGFEEDELYTDLNQRLTQAIQSTVSAGNTDGQAAPTEELASCVIHNAQAQAPDIQAANGEEKATCFQRATDSKESLNDPAPAAESSPWRPASLPFTFFDTHYKFTGRWFRQITPLVIWNGRSLGTNDIPKAPRLAHALGALGPMPQTAPHLFNGRRRSPLASLSTPSPRRQTFRVLHHALLSCGTQFLYRPNPRSRIYTPCAHIRKSFWSPSTPKLKLPTIRPKL